MCLSFFRKHQKHFSPSDDDDDDEESAETLNFKTTTQVWLINLAGSYSISRTRAGIHFLRSEKLIKIYYKLNILVGACAEYKKWIINFRCPDETGGSRIFLITLPLPGFAREKMSKIELFKKLFPAASVYSVSKLKTLITKRR